MTAAGRDAAPEAAGGSGNAAGRGPAPAGGGFLGTPTGLVAGALACCLLWGSAVPGVAVGYGLFGIPGGAAGGQMVFAGVRFALAGACILAGWSIRNRRLPRLGAHGTVDAAKLCLTWTVGQYTCYYLGLAHATGVSASLIQGLEVFTALVVGACVFHSEPLTARKVAGSLVGVGGLALFNWGGAMGFSLDGEGLLALATVFAAVASVLASRYSRRSDPVLLAGWQFVMGGAVLWAVGAALGGGLAPSGPAAWGVLAWLVVVSAVAYTVWSVLLATHPVSSVVVYSFTLPIFGVAVSLLTLGDQGHPLGVVALASIAVVCLGIWLVETPARRGRTSG